MLLSFTCDDHMWALPYSAAGANIPIEQLDTHEVEMYMKDAKVEFQKIFLPFKKLCKRKKVGFSFFLWAMFCSNLVFVEV